MSEIGSAHQEAWDAEYEVGRYEDGPPVEFVQDIIAAAQRTGLIRAEGLYIGCGNGRNYLPLVAGGLNLTGRDVSAAARSSALDERLEHRTVQL